MRFKYGNRLRNSKAPELILVNITSNMNKIVYARGFQSGGRSKLEEKKKVKKHKNIYIIMSICYEIAL